MEEFAGPAVTAAVLAAMYGLIKVIEVLTKIVREKYANGRGKNSKSDKSTEYAKVHPAVWERLNQIDKDMRDLRTVPDKVEELTKELARLGAENKTSNSDWKEIAQTLTALVREQTEAGVTTGITLSRLATELEHVTKRLENVRG